MVQFSSGRNGWPMPDIVVRALNALADADFKYVDKGRPAPNSRVWLSVGDVPIERIAVNPSLDVPRYGPDGEHLQVTVKARKTKSRQGEELGVPSAIGTHDFQDPDA